MVDRDKDVFQQFGRLLDEVHKVMVGQEEAIENIIIAILCDGHVLLESVPGMGKTMMAKTIAQTLDCSFARVQCTPDLTPKQLMGELIYNKEKDTYEVRKGIVFTNILLADEINRAPPITQSALLECMEEKQVTLGGKTNKIPLPFTVLATQNPVEQAGTYPLPEAQKDRFLLKVLITYPSREDEIAIVQSKSKTPTVEKIFNPAEVLIIRDEIVNNVTISDTLLEYGVKIVEGTRERREVQTGASPRASISLMRSCKARAFLHGRTHVTVEDIQAMAYPLLRHRIILDVNVRDYGTTSDEIIGKILARVEPP